MIYADDIDEAQYERMIGEWAALLDGGTLMQRELCAEALVHHFAAGEREFSFQLPTNLGELAVDVSFRGAPEEEPFVIRLEPERQH